MIRQYIKEQLRKVISKAAALRIHRFIPQHVIVRLYKAYLLPHLEYCSPLFIGIGQMEKNKLEDTNCYVFKTILGLPKTTSYEELLKTAKIETLTQQRINQSNRIAST